MKCLHKKTKSWLNETLWFAQVGQLGQAKTIRTCVSAVLF